MERKLISDESDQSNIAAIDVIKAAAFNLDKHGSETILALHSLSYEDSLKLFVKNFGQFYKNNFIFS